MLLAIDIGNTNIVAGVFAGDTLVATWRLSTESSRMPAEYAVLFESLFRIEGIKSEALEGVVVASVVPSAQAAVTEAVRSFWKLDPLVIGRDIELGIEVHYDPPRGVGADRIANAVAAVALYGTPAIVVDFGTGTNFDVISSGGAYLGGAIAPGLEIAQEALFSRTAQLPRVPLEAPPAAIGSNTITALQSGLLFGYAGLVDGLVERISRELDGNPQVIATGGLAPIITPYSRRVSTVDLDLTLVGLRLIHTRNTAGAQHTGVRQA